MPNKKKSTRMAAARVEPRPWALMDEAQHALERVVEGLTIILLAFEENPQDLTPTAVLPLASRVKLRNLLGKTVRPRDTVYRITDWLGEQPNFVFGKVQDGDVELPTGEYANLLLHWRSTASDRAEELGTSIGRYHVTTMERSGWARLPPEVQLELLKRDISFLRPTTDTD